MTDSASVRRVSVTISQEVYEELEAIAFAERSSVTEIIRSAVGLAANIDENEAAQLALRLRAEARTRNQVITLPGLIGPDGRPMSKGTPATQPLEAVVQRISDDVMRKLADEPHLIQEIHWHDFELLVAELFARDGFDVHLTTSTADGGVDLYAARHTGLGSLLYVVQCKRWKGPVGPGVVRELRGVIDRESATAGILATTSHFTRGAKKEQREVNWRLTLHAFEELRRWLRGEPIFEVPGKRST